MSESAAFNRLKEIERRSQENAANLPQRTEAKALWSGVGFSLAGVRFVVPMGEVVEISPVPRFTQVPGVHAWVKGVANVRGRLMPVLDLMGFLEQTSEFPLKRRRLLVLEQDEIYSGLVVDSVFGMQHFSQDDFVTELPGAYQMARPYLKGAYSRDDGVWGIFSLHRLAQDPRFMQVAS